MKSGVFSLACPETERVVLVTSSEDIVRAILKYKGDLKKRVGSPEVYRWLCELRSRGLVVSTFELERCSPAEFSRVKRKWIAHYREKGDAVFNINLSGKIEK